MSKVSDKLNELFDYLRRKRDKPSPLPLGESGGVKSADSFIKRHNGVDVTDLYPLKDEFRPLEPTGETVLPPLDVLSSDKDIDIPEVEQSELVETRRTEDRLPDILSPSSERPDADTGQAGGVDAEARDLINQLIDWLTDDEELPDDVDDEEAESSDSGLLGRIEELERRQGGSVDKFKPILLPDESAVWYAKVLYGTSYSMPYVYETQGTDESRIGKGWYVDEVDPDTHESFYPSRTRDAENNWIETVVYNRWRAGYWGYNSFFPIQYGVVVPVRPIYYNGVNMNVWGTRIQPAATAAKVTSLDGNGLSFTAEWVLQGSDGIGVYASLVLMPTKVNSASAYPPIAVGDMVYLAPIFSGVSDYSIGWIDMTPRISFGNLGAYPAGDDDRELVYDIDGNGGDGLLWTNVTDTP